VVLPGGWLPLPAAAALGAAGGLLWGHLRRQYRPGPPQRDHHDDAELAPLPPTMTALYHHHEAAGSALDPDGVARQPTGGVVVGAGHRGWLGTTEFPAAGMVLTGPGAAGAARGILIAVLTAATGRSTSRILTTTTDLATLFDMSDGGADGWDSPGQVSGLRLVPDLAAAVTALETPPDTAGPPSAGVLVLVHTQPPAGALAARLRAALARPGSAARAVFLDGWASAPTWSVAADGSTSAGTGAVGPRLAVLPAAAGLELLDTLRRLTRAAATTEPPEQEPPEQEPPGRDPAGVIPRPGHDPGAGASSAPHHGVSAADGGAVFGGGWPDPPPAPGTPRRLILRIMGVPSVAVAYPDGTVGEVRIRRSAGWQILVYLAVHRTGATSSELKEALWPDVPSSAARARLNTTISELRNTLHRVADTAVVRSAVDRTDPDRSRHWLDPDRIQVDLWHWSDARTTADTTTDPGTRRQILTAATAVCAGDLGHGLAAGWIGPDREQVARQVIDVLAELADTEPDHDTAVALLYQAIRAAPHNEALYRRVMRRHAAAGNPDGLQRTLTTLTERLTDLHTTPSPATTDLHTQLTHHPAGPATTPAPTGRAHPAPAQHLPDLPHHRAVP
jgi:DNA-binding SARP family transcriptional activator